MKRIAILAVVVAVGGATVLWWWLNGVGAITEKADLIRIKNLRKNQAIESPLVINGAARGYWFFEASFPVRLFDGDGREIAVGIAQAQDEWMTENFVPFEATFVFEKPAFETGMLVFQKDNPSGLPEHDDELRVPIRFR